MLRGTSFAVALLVAVSARAADPSEYTLHLTPADMVVIGAALGKLPYDQVADLVTKIRAQVLQQAQPPQKKDK